MNARTILLPMLVQIFLTILVYVLLAVAKARASRRGEVNLARRGLYDDAWPESVVKINNNIGNQFEVPVLFYVLCLALVALNMVTALSVVAAWLFVASRIVHAYIHIYPNHVPARRTVFMFGTIMVLVLAVDVALSLAGS
jgi:hypothetical protein